MVWDFAESNPFSDSAGNIQRMANLTSEVIERLFVDTSSCGIAQQCDATAINFGDDSPLISTDPPYYDNIGYADLSDFFYIWLRRSLNGEYSTLFGTVLTPKSDEIISTPFRHGGDASQAKAFFEQRLGQAIDAMRRNGVDRFPLTIFYAFKQSESELDGVASTGWETMLTGVIEAGFAITGTWPVRTERSGGFRNNNQNALASSIVLVCRPRGEDASIVTRRDFANALRKELPEAIKHLQSGNVAPVDLAQASIGPGMAVFSRYNKVINADGSPMSVREALQMINQMLDESLVEQESDFDTETRFALRWFEQFGVKEGPFGDAETLAKAMAVAVNGIVEAGIVSSKSGKVRLLKRTELAADWNPASDKRLTMWESTQHLIRALEEDGETGAADLLAKLIAHKGSAYAESVRELSYRLYQTCDRTKRAEEALSYNGLVVSWPEVAKLCRERTKAGPRSTQQTIFDS
jgi:putative DNA methylase